MPPVAAEHYNGYPTRMQKATTDCASSDPAACLHAWLSVHAGADPDDEHLAAALSARHRWLAPDKLNDPGAVRVLAVCNAVVELSAAEGWAVREGEVRRLSQSANELRAFLDKNMDVPKTAAAKQDGYRVISKMYGPENCQAANAFAFGPVEVFDRLECCWRDLQKSVVDAVAISHYEPRKGRRDESGLAAAAKHLHVAGFTYAEIAKLLPDGIPSQPEQAEERVRNRVRQDRRTIVN
jgi:hypothetical protein